MINMDFSRSLFNTASYAAPHILLFQRMPRLNPGLVRLWREQLDALTTLPEAKFLAPDWGI
jgi:hypothetical protein